MNISKTARDLYYSRSGVRHFTDRVRTKTGLNYRDPNDMEILLVMAQNTLYNSKGGDTGA
jgi:hypothetical protein